MVKEAHYHARCCCYQVMAGTGNLDVLRIARQLRKRHSPDVPYGSHMAVHMAIGLLFLGGGR